MRMRTLAWMATWLAMAAGIGLLVQWALHHSDSPGLVGRTLLGHVNIASTRIVLIETPQGQVTIRYTPWGWVVDELDGFSADTAKVRELLLLVGRMPIAQHVDIPVDRMARLGLMQKVENEWRFEAGKTASVLTLVRGLQEKHKAIYQVLVGNPRAEGGTYVRFPELTGAYLVRDRLVLDGIAEHWMEHRVFESGAGERVRQVRVQAADGAPFTLSRTGERRPWRLQGARTPPAAEPVRELLDAVTELRLVSISRRDAAPAAAAGPTVEVHFFDGSAVTLTFPPGEVRPAAQGAEPGRAAVLSASVDGASGARAQREKPVETDPVRREVQAFNKHFATRVVLLDAAQARTLLRSAAAYGAAQ